MSELITHHMDCPFRSKKKKRKKKSLDSITGKKEEKKKLQTENRNWRKSQFPGPVCSCVLTKHLQKIEKEAHLENANRAEIRTAWRQRGSRSLNI